MNRWRKDAYLNLSGFGWFGRQFGEKFVTFGTRWIQFCKPVDLVLEQSLLEVCLGGLSASCVLSARVFLSLRRLGQKVLDGVDLGLLAEIILRRYFLITSQTTRDTYHAKTFQLLIPKRLFNLSHPVKIIPPSLGIDRLQLKWPLKCVFRGSNVLLLPFQTFCSNLFVYNLDPIHTHPDHIQRWFTELLSSRRWRLYRPK